MRNSIPVTGIVRNTIFLTLSAIFANLAAFLKAILVGRYLPREEFGKFVFIFAFVSLFSAFCDLGLSRLTVREVSRDKNSAGKFLVNVSFLKLILSGLTVAAIWIAASLLGFSSSLKIALLIIGIALVIESFGHFFTFIFNSFERMGYTAIFSFLFKFFTLIGAVFVVKLNMGLVPLLWIHVFSACVFALMAFIFLLKKFILRLSKLDFLFCKDIILKGAPFASLILLTMIHGRFGVTLLKMFRGEVACAIYGAASYILMALMFITANLSYAIYPVFSRLYKNQEKEKLVRYYKNSFYFLFVLALPMAIGITLLSDRLVLLIWSKKYIESVPALKILVWRRALEFFTSLFTILMLAINEQGRATLFLLTACLFNILANLILTPSYSYIGTSISALLSFGFIFILYFTYISRTISKIDLQALIKPAIAALILTAFIFIFNKLNLFYLISLSIILYVGVLLLAGGFKIKELINYE